MGPFTTPKNLHNRLQFQPAAFVLAVCCVLMLPTHVFTSKLDQHNHNQLLVFNQCENQTSRSSTHDSVSSILSQLYQELEEKSSSSKFFQTSTGNDETAISALFQCRGDLSNNDCSSCVKKISELSRSLCGVSLPARVQLAGCKIHYQTDQASIHANNRLELLHKLCSGGVEGGLYGFQAKRDAAFAAVQECILHSEVGYCDQIWESVHVRAQCDGNLGDCFCNECVDSAVEIAREECGYSEAGEIYLGGCYLSYGYEKKGAYGYYDEDYAFRKGTSKKLVAIVIGGIAAVLVGVGLCLLCRRKKDDY